MYSSEHAWWISLHLLNLLFRAFNLKRRKWSFTSSRLKSAYYNRHLYLLLKSIIHSYIFKEEKRNYIKWVCAWVCVCVCLFILISSKFLSISFNTFLYIYIFPSIFYLSFSCKFIFIFCSTFFKKIYLLI